LTMRCNNFEHPTAIPNGQQHFGLRVGENVRLNGPIGGSGLPFPVQQPNPNANEWPVAYPFSGTVRGTFPTTTTGDIQEGWYSPTNWTSVNNLSANEVKYYRYENEFVHSDLMENPGVFKTEPVNDLRVANATGSPTTYDKACEGLITDTYPIFPTRVAVADSSLVYTSTAERLKQGAWLGNPVPNPAVHKTALKLYLPKSTAFALLQYVELGSGKVLNARVLEQRGLLELEIDTRNIAAGTYSIRLVTDGKTIGEQRIVVTK
ncbi:MAG TPA: hypothetical protein PKY12_10045, partial [Catalimonadaceae bacterium]|nr:hypothetical protein [Catalimonadaceae bacterium]